MAEGIIPFTPKGGTQAYEKRLPDRAIKDTAQSILSLLDGGQTRLLPTPVLLERDFGDLEHFAQEGDDESLKLSLAFFCGEIANLATVEERIAYYKKSPLIHFYLKRVGVL